MLLGSVKFGEKDSWDNFGLLLVSQEIEYPQPKTKMINVPGANSYLDLTEALSGEVKYENRKLRFKFVLYSYRHLLRPMPRVFWQSVIDDIVQHIHGKRLEIQPTWDECWYEGRCTINEYLTDKKTATVVIDCDCSSYKIRKNYLHDDWVWDTFSFIDGIISTDGFTVNGSADITLKTRYTILEPHFICSKAMTLVYDGNTYSLAAGDNKIPEIKFQSMSNALHFTCDGTGTVRLTYKEGKL